VFANKIRPLKTWCYTGLGTCKSDLCVNKLSLSLS